MKNSPLMLKTILLVVCLSALVSAGQAQNREKFVISARAGGVNSVAGRVMVTRQGQAPQLLTGQDDLVAGDTVTTGQGSQTEILLNPGSYLRVGENSEFTLVDNSLDNLTLKLAKGSAIIEATAGENAKLQMNVVANQQHFVIIRSGIYRINVQPASTELLVRKGRVLAKTNAPEIVKGGARVTYAAGETLARANEKISRRLVYGSLVRMSLFETAANTWGVWAYSPLSRSFTFMPFNYGWSSPYGHYYSNYCDFWRSGPLYGSSPSFGGYPGSGSSIGVSVGGSSSGRSSSGVMGTSGGSSTTGPSTPSSTPLGPPRDPETGSRNRIKDPD